MGIARNQQELAVGSIATFATTGLLDVDDELLLAVTNSTTGTAITPFTPRTIAVNWTNHRFFSWAHQGVLPITVFVGTVTTTTNRSTGQRDITRVGRVRESDCGFQTEKRCVSPCCQCWRGACRHGSVAVDRDCWFTLGHINFAMVIRAHHTSECGILFNYKCFVGSTLATCDTARPIFSPIADAIHRTWVGGAHLFIKGVVIRDAGLTTELILNCCDESPQLCTVATCQRTICPRSPTANAIDGTTLIATVFRLSFKIAEWTVGASK
mmetsp:Transcript_25278/g.37231  ORF Transcript_25278/g.37231 Transcript_25278/m.37231 type:complete len:268 (-) Transcript_25278:1655-2458(-)